MAGVLIFFLSKRPAQLRQTVRKAASALRAGEGQIRLITDALPILIAYVDRDLQYRFANMTAAKWNARQREDIIGRYPEEVLSRSALQTLYPYQPVEKGVIDRVSRHGEAYRGEGGFAILRDDEDDLNDQDGSSGRNKHEQGANSARHGLLRGAGADELAHQQR